MSQIVFLDTEVNMNTKKIQDFGAVDEENGKIHTGISKEFFEFIKEKNFICGHNILNHDLIYLRKINLLIADKIVIDTLYLSPLLFPKNPYHKLVKDDKLFTEDLNNPVNDSIKAKELFYDELNKYNELSQNIKDIFKSLLENTDEFSGFFKYIYDDKYKNNAKNRLDIIKNIKTSFKNKICENADIETLISEYPIELAYTLAVINSDDDMSITPKWVLMKYPKVNMVMNALRASKCKEGCDYCNLEINPTKGLKEFFGYDSFRSFDGKELQKEAATAALEGKSLLAIFPTGGGKSITFQVPAIMSGRLSGSLTVIISPLQSLMKDQVDNLESKGITCAVTINGLLDPIERAEAIERIVSGEAKLLYISPESLRSNSIEKLLLGRKIERFVIDEAHCFSAWGQDFRVDYLYIGEFIKKLYKLKNLDKMIPVSCFTATAKQSVVEDIKAYFKKHIEIDMEIFSADISRKNLYYKVIECKKEDKYDKLRMLIEEKQKPTIIYVSKTKLTEEIAYRLKRDGFNTAAYHGKMDKQVKNNNQEQFIAGNIDIMVATSAFGMGVDKSDVGLVIHYQISNSLENYVQEAGRAGRDQSINAECYILYDDNDLNEHFNMLNQSKLNLNEIGQIWKAIKDISKKRKSISQSALEIARKAGWDDNIYDLETRVKTAISALEQAGYIKRGKNCPRVYADSILSKNVIDASHKIRESKNILEEDKEVAIRLMSLLIGAKSRKNDENETRVDYLSDLMGVEIKRIIRIITSLKEEKILADVKDLSAFLYDNNSKQKSQNLFNSFKEIENFLFNAIKEDGIYNIKELNEEAEEMGLKKVSADKIVILLNYWAIRGWIKKDISKGDRNHIKIKYKIDKDIIREILNKRIDISQFILKYLYSKNLEDDGTSAVEFSVNELKDEYNYNNQIVGKFVSINNIEDSLLYLSKIGVIKIEGGFLVIYNRLNIERIEMSNRIKYKNEDYQTLKTYYNQKGHQIHIVGEYAKKMIRNYVKALEFVDDYFKIEYKLFLEKYFNRDEQKMINKTITKKKFEELFGVLSITQLAIINDKETKYIVVAAGPGSGKTKILVHKLASLLLLEDVKHEQLLMLTFSRASAIEFKKRLKILIGSAANYIDIKTFHSYCFDLQGRVGNIDKSKDIVQDTALMVARGEIEQSRITKTVMVIDEAQDMDENELNFVRAMAMQNENMRIIAVGDDDQNIYEFRGSSSNNMRIILRAEGSKLYELVDNYRSKANLINLSNGFATTINNRMKEMPIVPIKKEDGEISIYHYNSKKMIMNVINSIIKKKREGNTCILTRTNFEAMQIAGMMTEKNLNVKLIQAQEDIKPINLNEIRFFIDKLCIDKSIHVIDKSNWYTAKKEMINKFSKSDNLDVLRRIVEDFEETSGKVMYVSDFIMFLKETKIEDFIATDTHTYYVSTIHKSKGHEFDNVIMMLDSFKLDSEQRKREMYVALTRAKNSLEIHYRDNKIRNILDEIGQNSELAIVDNSSINPKLFLPLSYKDVFLSFNYKKRINQLLGNLVSGDILKVDEKGCLDNNNNRILMFSSKFNKELQKYIKIGYKLSSAKVRYVVFWKPKETEESIRILFPVIELVRK